MSEQRAWFEHDNKGCECVIGSGTAKTILLVEDEKFVREVTSEVLRSAGYNVVAAKDAAEAYAGYDALGGNVDLLVTDVILPGEPGNMIAEKLAKGNADLRVLFVTGYPEQMGRDLRRGEELLAKPFSTAALLQQIKRLLPEQQWWTVGYARFR